MKYLFAIIWGIIVTISAFITGVISVIIWTIWTFKFELFGPFSRYIEYFEKYEDFRVFPVFGKRIESTFRIYKTYFHYIWGFKSKPL